MDFENTENQNIEPERSEEPAETTGMPGHSDGYNSIPDDARDLMEQMRDERRKTIYTFIYGVLTGCLIFILIFSTANFISAYRAKKTADVPPEDTGEVAATLLSEGVEEKINELATLLAVYYYDDVSADDIRTGMYRGVLESVDDKYTTYYTAEEYESMMTNASATYYGIGAVLSQDSNTSVVTVLHVYENSPAFEAGLEAGDIIISANDIVAVETTLSELVQSIRGDEGTTVVLKVHKKDNGEETEYNITRRKVDIPTVDGELLEGEDNIGYIQIVEFGDNTADEFTKIYEDLEKQGMEKLIIDLRDNPGGMLNSVVKLCDYILPEGLVVYTEDKYENRNEYSSEASCIDIPMAVLINGNSASSSEIFAGAIRDYDYGTLIGTTTYGKGVVQTIKRLSDGSAVKITTSRYFTPKGENIHGVGIAPDIELNFEYTGDKEADYDFHYDNQMMKAIEVLTK